MPTWKVKVKIETVQYGYVFLDADTAEDARSRVEDDVDSNVEDAIRWGAPEENDIEVVATTRHPPLISSRSSQERKAQLFAEAAHSGQRYGKDPFIVHPAAVAAIVREYDGTDAQLAAAWLHDTVEDTDTTIEKIEELFGEEVAQLVHAVTNEEGANRHERHEKTYPKIRALGVDALKIKLADRIANVSACLQINRRLKTNKLLRMYYGEYAEFQTALYVEGELVAMWEHLDRLIAEVESWTASLLR